VAAVVDQAGWIARAQLADSRHSGRVAAEHDCALPEDDVLTETDGTNEDDRF
jgi:hypothetical protein